MTSSETSPARQRPLDETPALAAQAATLLRNNRALMTMSEDEARQVLPFMRLTTFPKGAALLREGDGSSSSYMLLVLEGDVSVDTGGSPFSNVPISVLGPGDVIGEMALFDGAPRSANCTALSVVQAAGLSRKGLELLVETHPKVAAKLILSLAQRMAERLRALGQQLQMLMDLAPPPPTE